MSAARTPSVRCVLRRRCDIEFCGRDLVTCFVAIVRRQCRWWFDGCCVLFDILAEHFPTYGRWARTRFSIHFRFTICQAFLKARTAHGHAEDGVGTLFCGVWVWVLLGRWLFVVVLGVLGWAALLWS